MAFRINKTQPGDIVKIRVSKSTRYDLRDAPLEILEVGEAVQSPSLPDHTFRGAIYRNTVTGKVGGLLWNTLVEKA
jgi:hypothetical protein